MSCLVDKHKLIFLDIDGVLNHHLYYDVKRQCERAAEVGHPLCDIDPEKIALLNDLIKETNAKVVISSTWRRGKTVDDLQDLFNRAGFVGEIVGKTPVLSYRSDDVQSSMQRGSEIHEYLYRNYEYDYYKRVAYVIFDDDSDMLLSQANNFLLVDSYCGLTPNITYKAKRRLNMFDEQSDDE